MMVPASFTWRITGALVAAVVVSVLLRASPPALSPASVILITLDTTRADRLGPYGGRHTMPTLDRWAREGIVFEDATTVAPLTLPAHTSLMTGKLPTSTDVRDNAGLLADDVPTIASRLHDAGYRTAAFVSSVILERNRGLTAGFDTYDAVNSSHPDAPRRFRRPATETVDGALTWLTAHGRGPFFLWIHLYDAHAPIRLDEPMKTTYASDPYDGAMASMDAELARLQRYLDIRHLSDGTAIVVAADHGEGLGEHGEDGHGIFVYQSVMHVPLIVRWPGARPARVRAPVQLTDVMPTILAIDTSAPVKTDGVNLTRVLMGRSAPARDIYTESMYPRTFGWSDLRSLRSGTLKVIDAPRPELYDLSVDPLERSNVFAEREDDALALLSQLRGRSTGGFSSVSGRAAVARQMASLGYVSAGARPPATALLPDPKDMIARYNAVEAMRTGHR